MIKFNEPVLTGNEILDFKRLIKNRQYCGDGLFTEENSIFLSEIFHGAKVLLTTSCTDALEMTALLLDIKKGDEIIMPSFTFVSTANAFLLRGANLVFVDIDPITMNMDLNKIKKAITKKTKAIVIVHYAGASCDMDELLKISNEENIPIIEDAAQAIGTKFNGKQLGSYGTFGCISFHETKNIHCGEGGALIINDPSFIERAHIIREKGTNRKNFLLGNVDKYTWVEKGSSFLMSEINASFLSSQLKKMKEINSKRLRLWMLYYDNLNSIPQIETIQFPEKTTDFNAHIFFIKLKNYEKRRQLIQFLSQRKIQAVFHYIPLHSAPGASKNTRFDGLDEYTTIESSKLLRLPLHNNLNDENIKEICKNIIEFFKYS
jgi:dTDP-4-amino-4,6-dideoxygalactose transaminase